MEESQRRHALIPHGRFSSSVQSLDIDILVRVCDNIDHTHLLSIDRELLEAPSVQHSKVGDHIFQWLEKWEFTISAPFGRGGGWLQFGVVSWSHSVHHIVQLFPYS